MADIRPYWWTKLRAVQQWPCWKDPRLQCQLFPPGSVLPPGEGLLEDKLPANPQTPRHIVPLQILAGLLLTKSKCEIQWEWIST